jgi:putative transposase
MRQLNGVYAPRYNRRHGRVGHVFQARFHATLVARDEHLLALAAYLPRNPVRAGLCTDPAHWQWSSYRATVGLEPAGFLAVDRLLSVFGESRETARMRYQAHVVDQPLAHLLPAPDAVLVGGETFLDEHTRALPPLAEVPRMHWRPLRPPLAELLASGGDAAIAAAYRDHAYTMREIAAALGIHYATVSRRLRRHETRMLECKT